jgi:hypothetical protein
MFFLQARGKNPRNVDLHTYISFALEAWVRNIRAWPIGTTPTDPLGPTQSKDRSFRAHRGRGDSRHPGMLTCVQ